VKKNQLVEGGIQVSRNISLLGVIMRGVEAMVPKYSHAAKSSFPGSNQKRHTVL
jgi:hypothetical protein